MKKFLFLLPFLFLGCCSLINNPSSGQVEVNSNLYHFTYSSNYWREADFLEMSVVKSESQNYDIEKIFYSKSNEDVFILLQSFDGESNCENLNAESLDYAVLNGITKQIASREWCIVTGYETTPSETSTIALTNCANKFVIFLLTNSDSDKSKADGEFNKILESFTCT